MNQRVLAVLLAFSVLHCNRAEDPAPKPAKPVAMKPIAAQPEPEDIDSDNLLNLGYGAAVVSRTAEVNLEASAINAIDGFAQTCWSTPPGGPEQTLVFAFAARARVHRLGVTTLNNTNLPKVRFEASLDGKSWREVLVQTLAEKQESNTQLVDVKPFEALYLRVSSVEPRGATSNFRSVHAIGEELAPPSPRNFGGCWNINGVATRIHQEGARITGVMATNPPTFLDGGTDGRVGSVMWRRGPLWGYAPLTITPQDRLLSGLRIFHEISSWHTMDGWFGKPCTKEIAPELPPADPAAFLAKSGRWSMFGLVFDSRDQLLEGPSRVALDDAARFLKASGGKRFRIVAHEVRADTPARNKQHTTARNASLRQALANRGVDVSRIEFVSAGSDWGDLAIVVAIQRVLASRIDLEPAK